MSNITFVYLGSNLPEYVTSNLRDTKERFKGHKVFFIGDDYRALKKVESLGIEVFNCRKMEISELDTLSSLSHKMDFRSGFWFKTISRFFALSEFQGLLGESVIQIESDVWLASNFPFHKFDLLDADIAFPMQNAKQGAASVLWLKSQSSAQKLADLTREVSGDLPNITDMSLLAKIANDDLMKHEILPSLSTRLIENSFGYENKRHGAKFDFFEGCFDALPYGMFLLGTDPRNKRGLSYIFRKQESDYFPDFIKSVSFNSEKDEIFFEDNFGTYPVYCLHNHAKLKMIWRRDKSRSKLLSQRCELYKKKPKPIVKFYPNIFLFMLTQAIKRRLKNVMHK